VIPDRPALLAAIDRRLWRDLGFADPEPEILRFLPMLVVAWADGRLGETERATILERARGLPEPLLAWTHERLRHPPGPYFRYQVAHLLAFLLSVWPAPSPEGEEDWATCGEQWATDLIDQAGWLSRLFGAKASERATLAELRHLMEEHQILASDRIWALARGRHAEFEPRHAATLLEDGDQAFQGLAITLDGPGERIAVGSLLPLVRGVDLALDRVEELLAETVHLRENERWIVLAEEVYRRGRAPTSRQQAALTQALTERLGHPFEECSLAELAYLEDALSTDARWMSWYPGLVEELRMDRDEVVRTASPGGFHAERGHVRAAVAQQLVQGPAGLGFRVLEITAPTGSLRLASPVLRREPPTAEAVQWIARFLPDTCDPCTQLVLDEDGPRWVAEVHPTWPQRPPAKADPLLPGRALLVPPWVWFRAASALGVRYFSGRRKGG